MRKSSLLTVLCGVVLAASLFAQEAPSPGGTTSGSQNPAPRMKHYFGLGAGFVSGIGLSYKYWPGKFGVQINLLPVWTTKYALFSIGLTGLYSLHETDWSKLFLYAGEHYLNDDGAHQSRTGGGFGAELDFFNFAINAMVGFQVVLGDYPNPGLYLGGDFGVHYRF
jgi:hypothetical protein